MMVNSYNNLLGNIRPAGDIPFVACDHHPVRSSFLGVNMKRIPLTQGEFALVDDEDYDWLNQWKWYLTGKGYAARTRLKGDGGGIMYMHRQILGTPDGMGTDHRDEIKLNNQRSNLRVCTNDQNACNRSKTNVNTSGFKGVSWNESRKKWQASMSIDGKTTYLGRFTCIIKAAKAYDASAKKHQGEFANLNFS